MAKLIGLIATIVIIVFLAGIYKFNYKANQPNHDVDGNKIVTSESDTRINLTQFTGNYVSDEYSKREAGHDWLVLKVNVNDDSTLQILIQSRNDIKKQSCSFAGAAKLMSNTTFKATSGDYSFLIDFKDDMAKISSLSDSEEDTNSLYWFCSGGGNLANYTFTKLNEKLDETQLNGKY